MRCVAGVDEAGRGPLAGPVVAAAVVLTAEQRRTLLRMGLDDSKRLSPSRRARIFEAMAEIGVRWKAQAASHVRIDSLNILGATLWAVALSVAAVAVTAVVTWQPRRTPALAGVALVAGLLAYAGGW